MKTATEKAKTPKYFFKRGNQFYYIRNIPTRHQPKFDNHKQEWKSLGSDLSQALILFEACKRDHDAIVSGEAPSRNKVTFAEEMKRAEELGITRKSAADIRMETLERQIAEMAQRIQVANIMTKPTAVDVAALAGVTKEPALLIMDAYEIFQEIDLEFTANLREWDAQQKVKKFERSLKDFIARCGDIDILTIDETVADDYLHSLWTDVNAKKFGSEHANRQISQVRQVLKPVLKKLYKRKFTAMDGLRVKLKISDSGKRLPFTEAEYRAIQAALPTADLTDQARAIIQLSLITGCGPKELCWLTVDDIRADARTPFIKVGPNRLRAQVKSGGDRHRDIPIATAEGVKLLKQFRNGFNLFQDDNGPSTLNKELSPFFKAVTPGKSFYSARHRLDDLIKIAGVDLGIKAAISGHSLGGHLQYYGTSGNGYTLKDKKEALVKALAASPIKEDHENEQLNLTH
jgi:integrase